MKTYFNDHQQAGPLSTADVKLSPRETIHLRR